MDIHTCTLCPRKCRADRTLGVGICGGSDTVRIARAALHFGEEPCISGTKGSGTVFFSGCALQCRFCQNHKISKDNFGTEVSVKRLAELFLELQDKGAHNINLVTPSHYAPWIADALRIAKPNLSIPIVCNCSGYESDEILDTFADLIDIYLPDLKYFSSEKSLRYSNTSDYFDVASKALQRMYAQVGPCEFTSDGLMKKGMLIRHLVLPEGKRDSITLLKWISKTFPPENIRISLMRQYAPCGDLKECPELNRKLFSIEYNTVVRQANSLGMQGFIQGKGCDNFAMTPNFDLTGVTKKGTLS
ncbi:MAG: radical SAM protein [Clostridia bacterium]|nr:radical SAM protein [Clostridia bacterium]